MKRAYYWLIALILGVFGFFRKSKASELPESFEKLNAQSFAAVEDDSVRKAEFILATGESPDTFEWCKGIFATWIQDQSANYNNFFQHGLKPIKTEDLQFAKASFEKGLADVNAELTARGL